MDKLTKTMKSMIGSGEAAQKGRPRSNDSQRI